MAKSRTATKMTAPAPADPARQLEETDYLKPIPPKEAISTSAEELEDSGGVFLQEIIAHLKDNRQATAIELATARAKEKSDHAPTLNLLAALQIQAGQYDAAERTLARAHRLDKNDLKIINNLAACHLAKKNFTAARTLLKNTLKKDQPTFAEFYFNLGLSLLTPAERQEAEQAFVLSNKISPSPETYIALTLISIRNNNLSRAESLLVEATRHFPSSAILNYYFSMFCHAYRTQPEAMIYATLAVLKKSDDPYFAVRYADSCRHLCLTEFKREHYLALPKVLYATNIDHSFVWMMWSSTLTFLPHWDQAFKDPWNFTWQHARDLIETLRQDHKLDELFVIAGLECLILRSVEPELIFRQMRQAYLRRIADGDYSFDDHDRAFVSALAQQCAANEYVYFITPDERDMVTKLADMYRDPSTSPSHRQDLLLVLACYASLTAYESPAELKNLQNNRFFARMVQAQVINVETEIALMSQIRQLTPVTDEVSLAVEQMYMENPYPRWTSICYAGNHDSMRLDPDSRKRVQVLIAGCGTGAHPAMVAVEYTNLQITAIDLSRRSLAYAKRKINELGFPNIEFAQADILELRSLKRKFDYIESVGVLHHLKDPMAGLEVLLDLLKPGGNMKLGLYSEIARKAVVASRNLVLQGHYPTTPDGIRQLREDVMSKHRESDSGSTLNNGDFYTLSTCRDLIFHVQETRYTIPQLREILEKYQFEFIGFDVGGPIKKRFEKHYPGEKNWLDLNCWMNFEEKFPDTFSNMYQFKIRKL